MKGTIIIPCLDSHEVVRRQLLWLDSWMKPFSKEWNLIIVDDGSSPKISIASPTNFTVSVIHIPPHPEKWTQPRARNVGTKHTNTEFLLFTDIDHILTPEVLASANTFGGDKLRFFRKTGALDVNGKLLTTKEDLIQFGATELTPRHREHLATCVIRKTVQDMIGGFNESFCGRYGPEDIDYKNRYEKYALNNKCKPSEISSSVVYVFPNPKENYHPFHSR